MRYKYDVDNLIKGLFDALQQAEVVEDDRVLINYSCWDRTTRIGIYDKKYIDSLIKYT